MYARVTRVCSKRRFGKCVYTHTSTYYIPPTRIYSIRADKGRGERGNGAFPRRGFELKAIDPRRDTNPGCLLSTNLAICHGVSHRERRFRPPSRDFSTSRLFRVRSSGLSADSAAGRIFHLIGTSLCIGSRAGAQSFRSRDSIFAISGKPRRTGRNVHRGIVRNYKFVTN